MTSLPKVYIFVLYIEILYIIGLYINSGYYMSSDSFEIANLAKNCNEALILSTLLSGKKHGYQLALEIEEQSGGFFKFNHGTLYPILHKLEKEGLITGTWKQEGPKRKRKYYKISVKGKKYVDRQTDHWTTFYRKFFDIVGGPEK